MKAVWIGLSLVLPLSLWADTLVFKDGKRAQGTVLEANTDSVRMVVGSVVQEFPKAQVLRIEFGGPKPIVPALAGVLPYKAPEAAPDNSPGGTLAQGTNIVVRLVDPIDSAHDTLGQQYKATVDVPIYQDGQQIIPRQADAIVSLEQVEQSGHFAGKTSLTVKLVSITLNGRSYNVNADPVVQASQDRNRRSAMVVGGAAALGALIGAKAGGGAGAAIGAGAGGAAGAGAQVMTSGQRVKIPAESKLTFKLTEAAIF